MIYAIPNFVLIYLFSKKKYICIYLTKSDFRTASAILWHEEGAWLAQEAAHLKWPEVQR